VLESAYPNTENSFDRPEAVSPRSSTAEVHAGSMVVRLRAYSVNVFRIPVP
jgi:alpha-L-arabinofuranosidase